MTQGCSGHLNRMECLAPLSRPAHTSVMLGTMDHTGETEIEMVQRHVREREEHVARQREIVERLPPSGEVAEMAHALLAELEKTLAHHRAHLARLLGSAPPP